MPFALKNAKGQADLAKHFDFLGLDLVEIDLSADTGCNRCMYKAVAVDPDFIDDAIFLVTHPVEALPVSPTILDRHDEVHIRKIAVRIAAPQVNLVIHPESPPQHGAVLKAWT